MYDDIWTGAKGLQAPIVILADAADNPDWSKPSALMLDDPAPGAETARQIPLPPLRKDERRGRIAAAQAKAELAEREEHWRLLYVAMTRAEEALFVAGSLGPREQGREENALARVDRGHVAAERDRRGRENRREQDDREPTGEGHPQSLSPRMSA